MDTRIVKLSFSAPVHFGDGRLTGSGYSCDAATLFSALFIEALRSDCNEQFLAAVKFGDTAISDAFPFIGDTLYLPRPMVSPGVSGEAEKQVPEEVDQTVKKAYKKLIYIPALLYGEYFLGSLDPRKQNESFKKLGSSTLQTKVNLTRELSDDAEPYHVGGFSFKENAGIYFIVKGSYKIEPLLERLQYSGIGGKRTSGYGRFEYSITTEDPLLQAKGSFSHTSVAPSFILMSSAAPTHEELTDDLLASARYSLVRKSGFVQSQDHSVTPQKKRDFYTFSAGSVFAQRFDGGIIDVNQTLGAHPVYRYAKALWMEV